MGATRPKSGYSGTTNGDYSVGVFARHKHPLGHLGLEPDLITQPHEARLEHRGVKAAHGPAGRCDVAGLHLLVVNFRLDRRTVNVLSGAGDADLCEFNYSAAYAVSLPGSEQAPVDSACGEVLAHGAVEDRIAARDQLVNRFRGHEEYGLPRASVDFRMRVRVAFEAKRSEDRFRDSALGNAAPGNADLDDGAGQKLNVVIQRELVRMRAQANGVHFLRALVIDIRIEQFLGEDVALQEELVVPLQRIERIFERPGH